MDIQVLKKIESMIKKTNCSSTKKDLQLLLDQLFQLNQQKNSKWIIK